MEMNFKGNNMSDHKPCPDCGGRGYSYSDPDGKQLTCGMCDGYGEVEEEMSEKKTQMPPDEPANLAEWLWRVKQHGDTIFVRELVRGHWETVALGSLEPREWAAQVARMFEARIVPTRIREKGEK